MQRHSMLPSAPERCAANSLAHLPSCEIKEMAVSLDAISDAGMFEGYACLFGKEDLGHDIIHPGAFARSLAKRQAQGIKLLYQHDPASPIGRWTAIREDAKGLYVRGQLSLEVQKAREVLAMMKSGILDGLSIGFRTLRSRKDRKSGIRHLHELDLWEISVVTFPMQPDARIRQVKTGATLSKRELERKLTQDAGLSRSQARALMAHGHHGLSGRQDAAGQIRELCSANALQSQLNGLARSMRQATHHLTQKRMK